MQVRVVHTPMTTCEYRVSRLEQSIEIGNVLHYGEIAI